MVATRPIEVNGLGLSVTDAFNELEQLKNCFVLLSDTASIFPVWESLIAKYKVTGKPSHDTRLVMVQDLINIKSCTIIIIYEQINFLINIAKTQSL